MNDIVLSSNGRHLSHLIYKNIKEWIIINELIMSESLEEKELFNNALMIRQKQKFFYCLINLLLN